MKRGLLLCHSYLSKVLKNLSPCTGPVYRAAGLRGPAELESSPHVPVKPSQIYASDDLIDQLIPLQRLSAAA
ncbi:hypothetical protein RRG08_022812 [Elysia crispata]|uniref:Uncharacterized protein n=1 Tax=Elysia crispata TaxID=231223 RepID=A0AAE0Z284_9GAST|nr:hypothetical protein RRG08_022812 [Elysia crispata]